MLQIRIQLRIFRDPDPCHICTYLLEQWSIFGHYKKNALNSIMKKYLPTAVPVQYIPVPFSISYCSSHSLELSGRKFEIIFLFICSFIFCWIRNNNFGTGSRKEFRIRHALLEKKILNKFAYQKWRNKWLDLLSWACMLNSPSPLPANPLLVPLLPFNPTLHNNLCPIRSRTITPLLPGCGEESQPAGLEPDVRGAQNNLDW